MVDQSTGQPHYEYEWQNPNRKTFDFGKVLGRSFSGVFAEPKPLLIGIAVVSIFTILMSLLTSGMTQDLVSNPDNLEVSSFLGLSIGGNIITLLMIVWFQLIVIQTSYSTFTNDPNYKTGVIAKAFRLTLPMFVIALIYAVVCILGFYALLIGFIFVWPGWALAGPVYVIERAGIFGSLGRAWNLSKGNKRWIFLLLFLLGILSFIIFSASTGIMMTVGGFNMFDPSSMTDFNPLSPTMIIATILSSIASYFLYAIFASGLTAAYVEIKEIREGGASVGDIFA